MPPGYILKPSGEIALVAGYDENDRPKSQIIIDLLVAGFRQDAAVGKVKATALVYDTLVVPPGAIEKSVAIAVVFSFGKPRRESMIGLNQFHWMPAQPRVAQPHRYVSVQFPTATNWSEQEVCS